MIIDILLLLLLCWGFYRGFTKGLILAVCSLLGYFIGILGALKFTYTATIYIEQSFDIHSKYLPFLTFILLFIALVILVRFIGILLTKLLKIAQINIFNKLAGAVLVCSIYIFMFSTLLWIFHQVNLISPDLKAESVVYYYIEPISSVVVEKVTTLIPFFQDTFHSMEALFEKLATKSSPLDV